MNMGTIQNWPPAISEHLAEGLGQIHEVSLKPSWSEYRETAQECSSGEKNDRYPVFIAVKRFSTSGNSAVQREEAFLNQLRRDIERRSLGRPVVLIERSRDPHTLRTMLRGKVATTGNKETAAWLGNLIGVIEVVEPPGWPLLTNIAMAVGEILVGIPVTLYKSGDRMGGSITGKGIPLLKLRIAGVSFSKSKLSSRQISANQTHQLLPRSIAETIATPNASTYVLASLMFGVLIAIQYHHNRGNVYRKPLLAMGVALGAVLSALTYCGGDGLHANAIMPVAVIVALLISTVMDTVMRWTEKRRLGLNLRTVERWMTDAVTDTKSGKRRIRFLTLH
jgi:hypothetical protein